MAAPTSYTEEALAIYMRDGVLKELSTALGWTLVPDDYQEAINEALLMMEVDSISEVSGRSNIQKLRYAAQIAVWRQVISATTGDYNFAVDGERYDRSQVNEQAHKALALAESDAMAFGLMPNYQVTIDNMKYIHDPYQYIPDDERTL